MIYCRIGAFPKLYPSLALCSFSGIVEIRNSIISFGIKASFSFGNWQKFSIVSGIYFDSGKICGMATTTKIPDMFE